MRLIVESGQSGAGKSVAIRVLEDLGYYCVDTFRQLVGCVYSISPRQ
ncbi:RNase adapter RapZ [Vibrio sp. J502]